MTGFEPSPPGFQVSNEGRPANEACLTGEMIAKDALRYTPAGIPILDARLSHRCELKQEDHRRLVEFDIALSFAGSLAQRANGLVLGQRMRVAGFLAPRRRQSKTLVLNVTCFEALPSASADPASHEPKSN